MLGEPKDLSPHPKGPVKKHIDVIVGGLTAGRDSSLARKAYTRAAIKKRSRHHYNLEITFQPEGEEYPDHYDALVISMRIANARVK
ncbi:hypothetical protein B296_00020712 [Ensete ventricosum]|uniref:Uncharacterized protein n=1 Tax=Ensete ventricosum TaxID=4639 RepID=A0A427AFH3_ENSVE|nr:hypothetical protein B296_00020712 [Ensete ventricosum]